MYFIFINLLFVVILILFHPDLLVGISHNLFRIRMDARFNRALYICRMQLLVIDKTVRFNRAVLLLELSFLSVCIQLNSANL